MSSSPPTGTDQASAQAASSGAARRGLLFIVSAPSGAGKTTLVERLVEQTSGLKMSRSYTSRAARAGEIDGVDYNFVSRDRFESMVQAGGLPEWGSLSGPLSRPPRGPAPPPAPPTTAYPARWRPALYTSPHPTPACCCSRRPARSLTRPAS